jgi:hypothetical protein
MTPLNERLNLVRFFLAHDPDYADRVYRWMVQATLEIERLQHEVERLSGDSQ